MHLPETHLYMLHTQMELIKSYNKLQFTSLVFTSLFAYSYIEQLTQ